MGFTFRWVGKNVHFLFTGKLDWETIHEADGLLYGSPQFDNLEYSLYDLSGVDEISLDDNDMHVISTLDKSASRWNNSMKLAIVAIDERLKAIACEYIHMMEGTQWQIKLFEERSLAIEWCNS